MAVTFTVPCGGDKYEPLHVCAYIPVCDCCRWSTRNVDEGQPSCDGTNWETLE
jgi:hypothetical protein